MDYFEHTLNPPGKRPEWLRDWDECAILTRGEWFGLSMHTPAAGWAFGGPKTTAIHIPLDHPAVPCLKWNDAHPDAVPFKPWLGGDAAPADWGGGEVLRRSSEIDLDNEDGRVGAYPENSRWYHQSGSLRCNDIIGYRPKPTEQTQAPSPELVEFVRNVASSEFGRSHPLGERARAILAELEPKVDPLVEALRAEFPEFNLDMDAVERLNRRLGKLAPRELAKEQ